VKTFRSTVVFKTSSFDTTTITYALENTSSKSSGPIPIKLKAFRKKEKEPKIIELPLSLKDNEYVRFVPYVCKSILTPDQTSSYMFLDSRECTLAGPNKVVVAQKQGKLVFYTTGVNGLETKASIDLTVLTMDFEYWGKKMPNTVYTIRDFVDRTDAMYDEERRIIYHISYQSLTKTVDGKTENIDVDMVNRIIPVKSNGNEKIKKRVLGGDMSGGQRFFVFLIVVAAMVGILGMMLWASYILMLLSFVFIVFFTIMTFVLDKGRILEGNVDVEYKKGGLVEQLDVESVKVHQERIKSYAHVTLNCFSKPAECGYNGPESSAWIRKRIVDVTKYNGILEQVEKDFKKKLEKVNKGSIYNSQVMDKVNNLQTQEVRDNINV
jgi:hypothetical protein